MATLTATTATRQARQYARHPGDMSDDSSDGGFAFEHPLFANGVGTSGTSVTPRREIPGHILTAAEDSPLHLVAGSQTQDVTEVQSTSTLAPITPAAHSYSRFGRRLPLSERKVSNEKAAPNLQVQQTIGVGAETPGHTLHGTAKPTASAARWKKVGRIGLGPPKRAERQSIDTFDDSPSRAGSGAGDKSGMSGSSTNHSGEVESGGSSGGLGPTPGDDKENNHTHSSSGSATASRRTFGNLRSSTSPSSVKHNLSVLKTGAPEQDRAPGEHIPKVHFAMQTRPTETVVAPPEPPRMQAFAHPTVQPLASATITTVPSTTPHAHATTVATTSTPAVHPALGPIAPASTKKTKSLGRVVVNGREYTRLDQIGKGGSSKVFRVMSSHGRIFALKRVDFESADAQTIGGYKSEIELLKRLEGSDRIIRLFDAEINDAKGRLSMLMECGEIDLAHLLSKAPKDEPPDLNFVRLYWRHMLEAVRAVHDEKIVHSDLKPANFLLCEGKLKLIDFGIAKAIGNDTTNIHRDQQIGTVNYMSPEALSDQNTGGGPGGARLMKLGRASDVWSLGCILYQMVYGRTPFSHLSMIQKIQAIPSPSHRIDFPEYAFAPAARDDSRLQQAALSQGGARKIDGDLLRVMRGCLERDPRLRLTIDQLLNDPFLKPEVRSTGPDAGSTGQTNPNTQVTGANVTLAQLQDLLRLAVSQTRERTLAKQPITAADVDNLAKDFYDSLRWRAT
ncbi:Serine/threonine kinase mps1 [Savitreella phatthalungensis]